MKGWRKGVCRGPKDGVRYWRVNAYFGEHIFVSEVECGKSDWNESPRLDWRDGNFFETKEKAEAAMVEWITEEAQDFGILEAGQ